MVVDKVFLRLFLTKVLERVSPENVAHETVGRGFAEAIDLHSRLVKNRAMEDQQNVRS